MSSSKMQCCIIYKQLLHVDSTGSRYSYITCQVDIGVRCGAVGLRPVCGRCLERGGGGWQCSIGYLPTSGI